jgi:hypothetical protein
LPVCLWRSCVESLLERHNAGLEGHDVLFQIRQVLLDDLSPLVLVRQARLDTPQRLRDREVFLVEPFEATVDLVEVSEHLVAELGDPGAHRVDPPAELANLMDYLAKPSVDLAKPSVDLVEALVHLGEALVDLGEVLVDLCETLVHLVEALVHLGEPAREEIYELLMLAGRHGVISTSGRSVVQVCLGVDTGDVSRPTPLG